MLQDHLTAKQKAAAAERSKRRAMRKAARILSSQELDALPPVKCPPPRTLSETEEDSETEPEEDTFSRPEPAQVIKLSAEACGSGGRFQWRGRLRGGGADVFLEGAWVCKNFKPYVRMGRTLAYASPPLTLVSCFFRYFIASVQAAGGRSIHIKTGNARPQQAAPAGTGGLGDGPEALSATGALRAIPSVECPEVAYQQGAADLCAAYGLASAMHEYGDTSGAAAIAACARAALTVSATAQTYALCRSHLALLAIPSLSQVYVPTVLDRATTPSATCATPSTTRWPAGTSRQFQATTRSRWSLTRR